MSKDSPHIQDTTSAPSSVLDRLTLAFEYNISWADEKKLVKERTA